MKIAAHRGYVNEEHRENTLSSISQAFQVGADLVEFDVHQTSDGVWILHHDKMYYQSSNPISTTRFEKLLEIAESKNYELTLLDQVINQFNEKELLIECKPKKVDDGSDLSRHLVDLDWSKRGCVASFSKNALRGVRAVSSDIPMSLLGFVLPASTWRKFHDKHRLLSISPNYRSLISNRIKNVHRLGLQLFVWTVNTEDRLRSLLSWGVDVIVTDELETALGVKDSLVKA